MRPWVWDPTSLDKHTSGTPVLERQSQADPSDSLFSQSSPIGKLRVHRKTHSILKPKAESGRGSDISLWQPEVPVHGSVPVCTGVVHKVKDTVGPHSAT